MDENYEAFATGGSANYVVGPDIASAATVAVTRRYHRVTGTAEISTITPPWPEFRGEIDLIPTGAFTMGTGGNISAAVLAAVGVPVVLHYDGLKWRPELASAAAFSAPVYEKSTTTNDGMEDTFSFTDPIVTLIAAFVGGVAQLPADCTVVAGDLVLADPPAAGADGVVTALYFD